MIVLSGSQLSAAGSSCDSNEKAAGSAYKQPVGRKQKMLSPFVFFREIFLLLNFPFYLNPFLSFPRYIICNTKEARQNRAEIRKRAVMGSE